MNSDEKHSLNSFLGLYLFSSFALLILSAFWYYDAQKQMHENLVFYKVQSIAEKINTAVVQAHMQGLEFKMPDIDIETYEVGLFDSESKRLFGTLANKGIDFTKQYQHNEQRVLFISTGTNLHLGVKYTVVQSSSLHHEMVQLRIQVMTALLLAALFIGVIGYLLLKIFMKPVLQRREAQDRFIKDTAHELNTPITALMMSTKRAMDKGKFDARLMRHISISTKQLYDLYTSLTYLSFGIDEEDEQLDLADVLRSSIEYFRELSESKKIQFITEIQTHSFTISRQKALKLFNNLISNAIKYSPPDSQITIALQNGEFSITDKGIGIPEELQAKIFDRYKRATDYAGGFGVGLSIVSDICRQYDIGIEIDSNPDNGTTAVLKFP